MQLLDCVQRLRKYADIENPNFPGIDYDRLASKFYSQRNLYLSGAILYLQVAIGTVVTIVRKMVLKEKLFRQSKTNTVDDAAEVEKLKHLIELKQQDIDVFKKQVANLQKAYDTLTPEEKKGKDE
ncbi:Endoplasmic reticulum transmembrane protein 1 [Candida tropicalis]